MFQSLLQNSYFSVFVIIALGYMLSRIKIKGMSLDVSQSSSLLCYLATLALRYHNRLAILDWYSLYSLLEYNRVPVFLIPFKRTG